MADNVAQHWHDIIGALGLILLAASYMSADLRRFRMLSISAFVVGAIYFILVPEGSNWVGVIAMAIYAAINVFLFARTRRAKSQAQPS